MNDTIKDFDIPQILNESASEEVSNAAATKDNNVEDCYTRDSKKILPTLCGEIAIRLNCISLHISLLEENQNNLEAILDSKDATSIPIAVKKMIHEIIKKEKTAINIIKICAEHQNILLADFLNFSKLQRGKIKLHTEKIDPIILVHEAITILERELAKKNVQILLNCPKKDKDQVFYSDRLRVQQILLFLISNAIKFSNNKGTIIITVSSLIQKDINTFIKFSIEDNGIGLSKVEIKRLFAPSAQENPKLFSELGGMRFELTMSKILIELLEGKLDVESDVEKGSIFTFTIKCKKNLLL